MRKLTKANVEALRNEMPVLEKNELEAVKGGGTVYNIDGTGVLGDDRAHNTNLYVMSAENYDLYRHCACGNYDPSYFFGGISLDKASEELQAKYVTSIMREANLLQSGQVEFFNGSGDIYAYYNNSDQLVFTISYGASEMRNKDELLQALQNASNNPYARKPN